VKPHPLAPAEPAPSPRERTSPSVSGLDRRLEGPLDLARRWAGDDRLALIVSGSHAAGDAVWVTHEGRPVSLSDLDVYAVVRDAGAKRAALARSRAARAGLGARLFALGLAAPLEVGFHTPEDLAALPARPGTLDLSWSGRVVDGDASWRDTVPAWSARDVARDEVWLLLENRAFELLWAAHDGPPDPRRAGLAELRALKRRHAVLKCALDLASVLALSEGEYAEGAPGRVAWARSRWDRSGSPEPPWDAALAWRSGRAEALDPGAAAAERLRTVSAWVATWRRLARVPADPADPFASVLRNARRARLRRRLREALMPDAQVARLRLPGGRIRHALAGTPRHRLNAAAAAHLMFEASSATPAGRAGPEIEALARELRRVLRRLGVAGVGVVPDSSAALVMAWDRGLLDGQRTEDWT
jgi:hypothetical protein